MRLLDYIQGLRKGKEAHRLEKESMRDPFLADAVDGYTQVEGEHSEHIRKLRRRVAYRSTRQTKRFFLSWSIAACLLIGLGVGYYFLHQKEYPAKTERMVAQKTVIDRQEPVPARPPEEEKPQIIAQTKRTTAPDVDKEKRKSAAHLPDSVHLLPDSGSHHPVIATDEERNGLDEVIVTGFGKASKQTLVGAISTGSDEKQKDVSESPQPVVGRKKYKKYLKKQLIRPSDEVCKEVRGTVVVGFRVNANGRPYSIVILEGLCESIDKEAIRLIQEGPDWTPGEAEAKVKIRF